MKFYQNGLGWKTNGIIGTELENGLVVLFELDNGRMLCLYERKNLAWDSKLKLHPKSPTEFSIGYFVNSDKEVDVIMEQAKKEGAKITKSAQKAFWGGYHGYFQDIDGHFWEIGHNPSANLAKFKQQLAHMPKDADIVIYCGCCPFEHCPNIRPAFSLLNQMKFIRHKLLNLEHNIKIDWINKGYPVNQ